MKISFILGTVMSVICAAPLSFADIVIQPDTEALSKDAKIYGGLPTSSLQSNLNVVSKDVGAHFLSLIQFDLTSLGSLTASDISSATLTLYSTGLGASTGPAVGGIVTLSPILNAWKENATDYGIDPLSTYDAFFGTTPTLTLGTVATSQNVIAAGFVSWDVTNLVKSWVDGSLPNYGLLLQLGTNGGDVGFASAASLPGVASSSPALTVIPEPSTYALILFDSLVIGLVMRHRHNVRRLPVAVYRD